MTTAEQERLDHLEAFEREMDHLRLVAAVSLALRENDTQELARLLGRPAPAREAPARLGIIATRAAGAVAIQAAAGLLVELLAPGLGAAGTVIGQIADALT